MASSSWASCAESDGWDTLHRSAAARKFSVSARAAAYSSCRREKRWLIAGTYHNRKNFMLDRSVSREDIAARGGCERARQTAHHERQREREPRHSGAGMTGFSLSLTLVVCSLSGTFASSAGGNILPRD